MARRRSLRSSLNVRTASRTDSGSSVFTPWPRAREVGGVDHGIPHHHAPDQWPGPWFASLEQVDGDVAILALAVQHPRALVGVYGEGEVAVRSAAPGSSAT